MGPISVGTHISSPALSLCLCPCTLVCGEIMRWGDRTSPCKACTGALLLCTQGARQADASKSFCFLAMDPQEEAAQQQPCSGVTDIPRAYLKGPSATQGSVRLEKVRLSQMCVWSFPEGCEPPSDEASAVCFSRCGAQATHWCCMRWFF